jgi:hypothetical protein
MAKEMLMISGMLRKVRASLFDLVHRGQTSSENCTSRGVARKIETSRFISGGTSPPG